MADPNGASASSSLVGRTVVSLRVADLQHHPRNGHFFGPTAPGEDAELREDIERQGLRNPLVVCGKGCASREGTILGGNRRYDACVALGYVEVPVVVHDGLSLDEELDILLGDNAASNCARRLKQSQLYAIEEAQRGILARRAGQRTDLAGGARGETSALVAAKLGQPENAVRNRQKVFGAVASPPELRAAVDAGELSLTAAAHEVRKLEKQPTSEQAWSPGGPKLRPPRVRSRRTRSVPDTGATASRDAAKQGSAPALPPPDQGDEMRSRLRSALEGLDVEHRRLLDAVSDLLGSFPRVPTISGSSTDSPAAEWAQQVGERWLPLLETTSAFMALREAANDLAVHAIGVLESGEGHDVRASEGDLGSEVEDERT